jgi:hypothetical protein
MILMHRTLACYLKSVAAHYDNGRILHAQLDFNQFTLNIIGIYGVSSPLSDRHKDAIFSDTAQSLNDLFHSDEASSQSCAPTPTASTIPSTGYQEHC